MVFWENVIHIIYFIMAGLIAFSMIKSFFKRKKNQGYVFSIMYAYCLIPFLLRILWIK